MYIILALIIKLPIENKLMSLVSFRKIISMLKIIFCYILLYCYINDVVFIEFQVRYFCFIWQNIDQSKKKNIMRYSTPKGIMI